MNPYDNFGKDDYKAPRKRVWQERLGSMRWFLRMIEFTLTALVAGVMIAWLAVGAVMLTSGAVLGAESGEWLHEYNKCRHELSLKGHKVEHAIRVCNGVADIEVNRHD